MPRRCSSGRRSVSLPVSARTSQVLPWSMCPAVPTVSAMPKKLQALDHDQARVVLAPDRGQLLERPEPARRVELPGRGVVLARVGWAERLHLQVLDATLAEKRLGGGDERRADPAPVALRPYAHDVDLGRGAGVELQREKAVAADGERRQPGDFP